MNPTAPILMLAAALALPAGAAQAEAPTPWPLPSFLWSGPALSGGPSRWDGQYLSVSSGFSVTKFRRGPTVAAPEIGIAAGRHWRDGNFVYGLEFVGSYSPATARFAGVGLPSFTEYTRDFAAGARFKFGALLTPDVLVYSSVGAVAVHDRWRSGPALGGFSRDDVQIRPDVRAGVQWAVTPNLTLGVEVGAQPGWR